MPRLQSIALLGMLLSCTALGAGLDRVRVGRYSAIVIGPSPEQADPFALRVDTAFRARVPTVLTRTERLPAREPLCLLSVAARAPWLALTSGAPKARADAPRRSSYIDPRRVETVGRILAVHAAVRPGVYRLIGAFVSIVCDTAGSLYRQTSEPCEFYDIPAQKRTRRAHSLWPTHSSREEST